MTDGVVGDIALGANPEPISPAGHEPVARTVAVALCEHWEERRERKRVKQQCPVYLSCNI